MFTTVLLVNGSPERIEEAKVYLTFFFERFPEYFTGEEHIGSPIAEMRKIAERLRNMVLLGEDDDGKPVDSLRLSLQITRLGQEIDNLCRARIINCNTGVVESSIGFLKKAVETINFPGTFN